MEFNDNESPDREFPLTPPEENNPAAISRTNRYFFRFKNISLSYYNCFFIFGSHDNKRDKSHKSEDGSHEEVIIDCGNIGLFTNMRKNHIFTLQSSCCQIASYMLLGKLG